MTILFNSACWSLGAYVLFSIVLLGRLRDDPLCEQLFAVPNAWLGPRPKSLSRRYLRAKFFLPWVQAPSDMARQSVGIRAMFWVARLAGAGFVVAILAFFVSTFLVSAH